MNYIEILNEIGYQPKDMGNYLNLAATWRGGNDTNSVAIYKDHGTVLDFVTGETYTFEEFLRLITKSDSSIKIEDIIKNKLPLIQKEGKPCLKDKKIFPIELLDQLFPDQKYWVSRGISEQTARLFRSGLAVKGKLKGRQILPIFNSSNQLVGFTGRSINGIMPKYKTLGSKNGFVWPAFLNLEYIKKTKKVILVESPACVLKMWDAEIKNVLCLFGTEISFSIINFLLKIDPDKIIISTNNEESGVGNKAAEKIEKKLKRYFDSGQIFVHLPNKKDFGEMSLEEIVKWNNLC